VGVDEHRCNCTFICLVFQGCKYGIENIVFEIIDLADSYEELCEKEKYYIELYDSFNNGYNCTLGGEGTLGRVDSEETKKKKKNSKNKYLEENGILNRRKRFEKKLQDLNMTKEEYIRHVTTEKNKKRFENDEERVNMALKHGGKPFLVFKKETNEFVGEWLIQWQCARELDCIQTMISRCLKGKTSYHHGYIFIYKDEYDETLVSEGL
jgi:group I intron endonuclease